MLKNGMIIQPLLKILSKILKYVCCLFIFYINVLIFLVDTTMNDVRLLLAQEEAVQIAGGVSFLHDVSPVSFLLLGFELEEQQCDLNISSLIINANLHIL